MPSIQWLEPRRLLSASFATISSHGTLSVIGTAKNDVIRVSQIDGQIIAKVNSAAIKFPRSMVKRIWITGFRGNDRVVNDTALPSTVLGSGGDDTLRGGSGDDSLAGGAGSDTADYSGRSSSITARLAADHAHNQLGGGGGAAGEHD